MKQGLSILIFALALRATSTGAATFSVINTNDSGAGSLRQAMLDANASPGADDIRFNFPGAAPFSIAPKSALPPVIETLTLDATTQPGFAGKPIVELDGHLAGAGASGLVLNAPGGCVVRGLVINRFTGAGILATSGGNTIQGNFIGTDVAGLTKQANRLDGINLSNSASNLIGGATSGAGNLISGNLANGVQINGTNSTANRIMGNLIGTDATGTAALGNGGPGLLGAVGNGVYVVGAQRNQIGGPGAGERNIIGGNSGDGVKFFASARSNVVQGNFIGVDASGVRGLGNTRVGVWIENSPANLVGGNFAGAGNLISSNGIYGVGLYLAGASNNVVQGNWIGSDMTGANALGNVSHGVYLELANRNVIGGVAAGEGNVIAFNHATGVLVLSGASDAVRGNRIFRNGGLGIDLAPLGVNPNDALDVDAGANLRQNSPVLNGVSVSPSGATLQGFLSSRTNTTFDLDFYANDLPDVLGYGEGQSYLTSQQMTTGAGGLVTFNVPVSSALASNQFITATATDPAGNTSEFSLAVPVVNAGDTFSYAGNQPALPEVRAALQSEFGGFLPPAFTETQDTTYLPTAAPPLTLQFRFLADTGGFLFQFGVYRITPELAAMDLATDAARIAYARAALAPGNAVVAIDDRTTDPRPALTVTNLEWSSTDRLGFFLVPDSTLDLFQTQPDTFALYGGGSESQGYAPTLYGGRRWPLFSEWRANPGGKDQLLNFVGVSKITKRQVSLFAWEDLTRASVPGLVTDTRFNDLIFTVEGVNTVPPPVGEVPAIVQQPRSQFFDPGATITFDVIANGASPLSYQWLRNGLPLPGETNATLTVKNARNADAGVYSVRVRNSLGAAISNPATLALATCVTAPAGLIAWWPGDGTANDLAGTNHGTLRNGAGFAAGIVGQAFSFDGVDDFVSVPHSPAFNPTGPFSVETWIKADARQLSADHQFLIVDKSHGFTDGTGWALQGTLDGQVSFFFGTGGNTGSPANFPFVSTRQSVLDAQWHHVAGVFTGSELEIFLDGELQGTLALSAPPVNNEREVHLGAAWGGGTMTRHFHGLIDEVSFYNRAISASEVAAIFTAGGEGKCKPGQAPEILLSPENKRIATGGSATLRVRARGDAPLLYQWRFNGTNIPGATDARFVIANAQPADAGDYSVVVSNQFGSADSTTARVLVRDPVRITSQPVSQIANPGENISFTVVAVGAPPLRYQWRRNGVNLAGETNATLALLNVQPGDGGIFTVAVDNGVGAVESEPARLFVQRATLKPGDNFADRSTLEGSNGVVSWDNVRATFEPGEPRHAGKRGGHSIWYRWIAPANGVATFTSLGSSFDTLLAVYTGKQVDQLALVAADEDAGGFLSSLVNFNAVAGTEYEIVCDGFGGATGDCVLAWRLATGLTPIPEIVVGPKNQAVLQGANAAFAVEARGGNLQYQWFFNGQPISGATASTHTETNAQPAAAGNYTVQVKLGPGAIESQPAHLDVVVVDQGASAPPVAPSEDKLEDVVSLDAATVGLQEFKVRPAGGASLSRGYTARYLFSTQNATRQESEPNHCGVIGGASQWYALTNDVPGQFTLNTSGSAFDTVLAVYTLPKGSALQVTNLVSVACDSQGANSTVDFAAQPGVTYYIVVDGVDGAKGAVQLSVDFAVPDASVQLTGALRALDGRFHFHVIGKPGASHRVEVSSDLKSWVPLLQTNVVSGEFDFDDAAAANLPIRFYRAARE